MEQAMDNVTLSLTKALSVGNNAKSSFINSINLSFMYGKYVMEVSINHRRTVPSFAFQIFDFEISSNQVVCIRSSIFQKFMKVSQTHILGPKNMSKKMKFQKKMTEL